MSRKQRLEHAIRLFEQFSGHAARYVDEVPRPEFPDVALKVGRCLGILYETTRDGKKERYIHEFRPRSAPLLVASADGENLFLLGGRYRFTDAGIVDK